MAGVKVYDCTVDRRRIAGVICERAWLGQGVRVYRWPCFTVAVVSVGSRADAQLLADHIDCLLVTYARHGLLDSGRPGPGPLLGDVLRDLLWARTAA